MKTYFAVLVILSILGIAGAGIFAMNHDSGAGHSGCIAASAKGIDCPEETTALIFLNFHFDALKSILTATSVKNANGSLAAFMMSVFIFLIFGTSGFGYKSIPICILSSYWLFEPDISLYRMKSRRWLALHENSPQFLIRRRI